LDEARHKIQHENVPYVLSADIKYHNKRVTVDSMLFASASYLSLPKELENGSLPM
jgi:hypothetical protein